MQAYSKDLRIRVIDAVDRGVPRAEVAEQFMVSLRTIKRWLQRRRETGNLAASPRPGATQTSRFPRARQGTDESFSKWPTSHPCDFGWRLVSQRAA